MPPENRNGMDHSGTDHPLPEDRTSPDPAIPTSLRERKKARTRSALIDVSQRLFAERGYNGTTLEEISAEVEITTQTLLRYFDSKAQLALAPVTAHGAGLQSLLEDPNRSSDTLAIWRDFLTLESGEGTSPSSPTTAGYFRNLREFRKWMDEDPVLVAMGADIERRLREMLSTALAADCGAESDDLHSILLAAVLVAGRTAVWDRWLAGEADPDSLLEDHMAVVDYATKNMPRTNTAHRNTVDRPRDSDSGVQPLTNAEVRAG